MVADHQGGRHQGEIASRKTSGRRPKPAPSHRVFGERRDATRLYYATFYNATNLHRSASDANGDDGERNNDRHGERQCQRNERLICKRGTLTGLFNQFLGHGSHLENESLLQ